MPTFLFVHTSLSVHCCASGGLLKNPYNRARRLRKKQGKSSKLTAENSCSEVGGRRPYINFPFFFLPQLQGLHQLALKN
uniref:Uncharacterized protein n=1 Tax=Populus trichocarpa TaxID=3694 RepID=A0A2K2BQ78_POPTR